MWMVRNNGGDYAEEFIKQSIVAIGWKDAGPTRSLLPLTKICWRS